MALRKRNRPSSQTVSRRMRLEQLETRAMLTGSNPPVIDSNIGLAGDIYTITEGEDLTVNVGVSDTDGTIAKVILSLDGIFGNLDDKTYDNIDDNGVPDLPDPDLSGQIVITTLFATSALDGFVILEEFLRIQATDDTDDVNVDEADLEVLAAPPNNILYSVTGGDSNGCGVNPVVVEVSASEVDPRNTDSVVVYLVNNDTFVLTIDNATFQSLTSSYVLTKPGLAPGNYSYFFEIFDEDGDVETVFPIETITVEADGGTLSSPGVELCGDTLMVLGAAGADTVTITAPTAGEIRVQATFADNSTEDVTFTASEVAAMAAIYVSLGEGDDSLLVAAGVTTTLLAFGEAGDDVIVGGGGSNVLVGGSGSDVLSGRALRDILIGGADSDLLYGGAGQDILIDGATSHDGDTEALLAILAEWNTGDNSLASRQTRINHLTGPIGGLNGTYFLNNLIDDSVVDLLLSGAGMDWILRHNGDVGF